jgi:hypothetical protein
MIALTNIERPTETETRGYSGNQQVEVSETNFYNIDGGGVAGGAISCNSSNSLSTLDCSIANTSTISSGGSLHIYYASSMNIQRLNCVNGSAAQAGGHIHIALTTGSGIVKECHLENGTCGTNFGGGGIWVRDLSVGNPLTFSLIEFVNCCSKCGNITMGGGGGMFVAHNSLVSLSNSLFFELYLPLSSRRRNIIWKTLCIHITIYFSSLLFLF